MKVRCVSSNDEDEGRLYYRIEVDGKKFVEFCDGEPEDNSIGRNFNDIYLIDELIRKAHKAGYAGEELKVEQVNVPLDDF